MGARESLAPPRAGTRRRRKCVPQAKRPGDLGARPERGTWLDRRRLRCERLSGLSEGQRCSSARIDRDARPLGAAGSAASSCRKLWRQESSGSARGVNGGFVLAKPAHKISALDIIQILEGPIRESGCLLLEEPCEHDSVCRINAIWRKAQHQMLSILRQSTLADMADSHGIGNEVRPSTALPTRPDGSQHR